MIYLFINYKNRNPLRKHAYSNALKILPQKKKKNENFQIKNSDIFFYKFLLKT